MNRALEQAIRSFLYLALLLLVACSNAPKINLLQYGDQVSIRSQVYEQPNTLFEIRSLAVGGDATTGAGSGALAGAALGLTCGPYAIICSPLGALTGAIVGGVGGAAVGALRGLDSEQITTIKNKMASYLETHNPQEQLVDAVIERSQLRWNIVPLSEDNEILIHLSSLELQALADKSLMLVMQATVTVRLSANTSREQIHIRKFDYQGSPIYVGSWAEDNEIFLSQRFKDAYSTLTENIVMALSGH